MLVLTRLEDERVIITTAHGERIEVLVVKSGGPIKLGFEADKSVAIHREEIQDEIDAGWEAA